MARYIDADRLWGGRPQLQKNKYADERYMAGFNECMRGFSENIRKQIDIESANVVSGSDVARCKDCVYFQPNFVLTNNGERRPYTEEEKNSTLGMVTSDVGINCGSRCERFDYWEDNRFPVWFQENDYCSYFKKKYTEEQNNVSKEV